MEKAPILFIILFFTNILTYSQYENLNDQFLNDYHRTTSFWIKNYEFYYPLDDLLNKGANINSSDNKDNNLLHKAVYSGDINLVKFLVYKGIDVNKKNSEGFTPLDLAKKYEKKEIINFLESLTYDQYFLAKYGTSEEFKQSILNDPENINKPDKFGYTVLDYVIGRKNNSVELMNFLIEKNVDLNFSYIDILDIAVMNNNIDLAKLYSHKDTIQRYLRPVNLAIRTHNLELVKLLVEKGANIKGEDYLESKPLQYAYENKEKNKDIIRYLIKKGVDISPSELTGKTPLHELCEVLLYEQYNRKIHDYYYRKEPYTDIETLEILLEKGVDINAKDYSGNTALHYAAMNPIGGKVINFLLKHGANDRIANDDGKFPYDLAVDSENPEALINFIEKGYTYDIIDKSGNNLLHRIVKKDQSDELIKLLIEKGLDPNQKNNNLETPLIIAAENNNKPDNIIMLRKLGADVSIENKIGQTPFQIALRNEKIGIIKYFILNGADPKYKDYSGANLIHYFAKYDNQAGFIDTLVKLGADPKAMTLDQFSPLHNAAKYNKTTAVINKLLSLGLDINIKDRYGKTPLHYAVYNDFNIVKYLTENGADINIKDKKGQSPFYKTIKNNLLTEAEYLFKNGANAENIDLCTAVSTKNIRMVKFVFNNKLYSNTCFNNKNPLEIALKNKNIEIFNFLISKGAKVENNKLFYDHFINAVKINDFATVSFFIKSGFNPTVRYEANTPLHESAKNPDAFKITKLLIEKGVNINAVDLYSMTPLNYSLKNNNTKATNLLNAGNKQKVKDRSNDLLKNTLLIYDRIPLCETHYNKESNSINDKLKKGLFYKSENFNSLNYPKKFYETVKLGNHKVYSDYYPYLTKYQKLNAYNPILNTEDIKENFGEFEDEFEMIDPETGEWIIQKYIKEADPEEIDGIVFYDAWDFNSDHFTFKKHVYSYSPIRHYYRDEDLELSEPRYRAVSFTDFDHIQRKKELKTIKKRSVLFKKVKYEFLVNNDLKYQNLLKDEGFLENITFEKNNSPFWTSLSRETLVKSLIDEVISAKRPAYDFYTGDELIVSEIFNRLGANTETISIIEPETGESKEITIDNEIYYEDIQSIIFIEDWYYDQKTLNISKEVIGIAPVRWYYSSDDYEMTNKKKIIPFVVYFKRYNDNSSDKRQISITTPIDSNFITLHSSLYNTHFLYKEQNINSFNFKESFVNAALNNTISLYSNFDRQKTSAFTIDSYEKINTVEFKQRIGISVDTLIVIDPDTGNEKLELIKNNGYGTDSICLIHSNETWKFDKAQFKFYKDVYSYAPAIRFYRENNDNSDPRFKLIGYILNNPKATAPVLFKKIKYEFGYEDFEKFFINGIPEIEKDKPLFWSNFHEKTFKEIIFDMAIKGEVNAYDFETQQVLSENDLQKKLIINTDTVYKINSETGETEEILVENKIDPQNINSFIFIEDWYINPKTLDLKKEVIGIAPVVYFFENNESNEKEYKKIIPFVLYFYENKKF